ncbi:hypothetical protein HY631_00555 [Candidatus Uhrbacteria bacterium]|nr:hypothetical protein [Candidatus Uhrbacteria bacterium]
MLFLPLLLIPLLFLAVVFLTPRGQTRASWRPCAICVAVSATWALLIALTFFSVEVDPLVIGVLMGMSVTGLMSKLAEFYQAQKLKYAWLARLITILGGFYAVVWFLQGQTSLALLIALTTVLTLVLITFLFQGVTHQEALAGAATDGQRKSAIKKLDNCC